MNGSNLKIGIIISYLWVVIHIGANFVYAPLLINFIGKSEYGLYQIIASFLAYINVLETSLSSGVLRFYCNAKAKNNEIFIQNVLAICKKIYNKLTIIIVGVGMILVIVFRLFYASSFTDSELIEGEIMLSLLIFNICITMMNALYLACIRGNERYTFEKLLSIVSQILQPILCLLILYKFPFAVAVTFIQVFMNIIVSFIRYKYAINKLEVKVVIHNNDILLERQIIIFAGGLLLSNIADQIFWKTDQIILAKIYNTALVAIYAIGAQIYTNYMYVGTTIAGVFFPRVSILYQKSNGIELISFLFTKVGRIAFLACNMVLSAFIIFGKEFIYFWVGEGYDTAYYVAVIVMIPFTIDIIQNLGLTILQVMDKYSFRAKMYFVAAILNIFLTILLANFFAGIGAAISTGISMFVTSGIILNIYYLKVVHLDVINFWKNIGKIFAGLLPVTIFGLVGKHILGQFNTLTWFFIKIVLYVVLYSVAGYTVVMNEEEKNMIRKVFYKIAKR